MDQGKIAIIVLNWNGLSDTLECIASLKNLEYSDYTVIIADNGSTDNSLKVLRESYPEAVYLDNKENLGFAEGNNRAIRYALDQGFVALFILNNDTVVSNSCLSELLAASRVLPSNSVLGCQIRYYNDAGKIWNFGSRWDEQKLRLRKVARNQAPDNWQKIEAVDHVVGCAMLIPAHIVKKIGLFDARFFLNYEETDWCFRARAQDVQFYSIPKAVIYHKVSASFVSSAHLSYYISRNRFLWIEKNFPFRTRVSMYLRQDLKRLLEMLTRMVFLLVKAPVLKFTSRDKYRNNNVQIADSIAWFVGMFDYFRRSFGACPEFIKNLPRK